MKILYIPVVAALLAAPALAQDVAPNVSIIPRPESLTVGRGEFKLTANTVIYTDAATADIGRRFAVSVLPATGFTIPVRTSAAATTGIALHRDQRLTRLGDEGYELTITSKLISIRAKEPAGVFYGLQSVRQLLPPQIFRAAKVDSIPWIVPAVKIIDRPRFTWR